MLLIATIEATCGLLLAKQQGLTEELIDDGIDNYETSDNFTEAEKMALKYSELMDTAPEKIDAQFYKELGKYFTTEEIVELGSYIGFNVGYHRILGTPGLCIQCSHRTGGWSARRVAQDLWRKTSVAP